MIQRRFKPRPDAPLGRSSGRGPFLLSALLLTVFLLCGCGPKTSSSSKPAEAASPQVSEAASSGVPAVRIFEDITAQIGLNFIHDANAKGEFFLPEQYGSGCAFFDYDGDGRMDVYLVQCAGPGSGVKNRLYHHEPDGTLRDVSEGSGLDVDGRGMGVAVGDVNNDGRPDLALTEYTRVRLFLNLGQGRFRDITEAAGIDNPRWAAPATFFDYDRDGWLDLVIGNYLDYSPSRKCFDNTGALEYCGPQNFESTVTRLYHNRTQSPEGPVRFEDVTVASGLAKARGKALGILCADFDGDRWPDIFITDDGLPNRLFINQRNGTFTEEAAVRGVAYNSMGSTAANMGIALGDVNGDGLFDLFVTHLSVEQHALWVQGPRGLFLDRTAEFGLVNPAWRGTAFGDVFADFDHDGWCDLAIVNGRIARGPEPAPRLPGLKPFWHPYAQRYQIFMHNGANRFVDVSLANPDFCGRAAVGRGLAWSDWDDDGDVDLLSTSTGGPAQFFRNIGPKRGHWLLVRALDPTCGGRDAYGAELLVQAGGRRWWGLVQPNISYLSVHDPRVHFGLGQNATFTECRVIWPDGTEEVFPGGPADRQLVLHKGSGHKP